jgi:type I restriction enzyme S subunit
MKNISRETILTHLVPLPPLAEQTEIVARVGALMERCRELEAEIARSRAHAEALLQAVLREAFAPAATS